jgi:hypothetical protein
MKLQRGVQFRVDRTHSSSADSDMGTTNTHLNPVQTNMALTAGMEEAGTGE